MRLCKYALHSAVIVTSWAKCVIMRMSLKGTRRDERVDDREDEAER
jgi:hypothetical protein